MHLHHPSLSLNGHRRGRTKFRNADEARRARELQEEWERNQRDWASMSKRPAQNATAKPRGYSLSIPPGRATTRDIPSVESAGHVSTAPNVKVYTGSAVVGIAVMHKSCLQPVFNREAAIDSAKMRRG